MPSAPATIRREPYPQTVGRPGFSGRSSWSACGGQRLRALQLARAGRSNANSRAKVGELLRQSANNPALYSRGSLKPSFWVRRSL
jgi:hypothetical protein